MQRNPPSRSSVPTRSYSRGRPCPRRLRSIRTTGSPAVRQASRMASSSRADSSLSREGRKNTPLTPSAAARRARRRSSAPLAEPAPSNVPVSRTTPCRCAISWNPLRVIESVAWCHGPGVTRKHSAHLSPASDAASSGADSCRAARPSGSAPCRATPAGARRGHHRDAVLLREPPRAEHHPVRPVPLADLRLDHLRDGEILRRSVECHSARPSQTSDAGCPRRPSSGPIQGMLLSPYHEQAPLQAWIAQAAAVLPPSGGRTSPARPPG